MDVIVLVIKKARVQFAPYTHFLHHVFYGAFLYALRFPVLVLGVIGVDVVVDVLFLVQILNLLEKLVDITLLRRPVFDD